MKNICDNCGNDYERNFMVQMEGQKFVFDCFECAIHKLAPVCAHCQSKVIGHGVEKAGRVYCCPHCAEEGQSPKRMVTEFAPHFHL